MILFHIAEIRTSQKLRVS